MASAVVLSLSAEKVVISDHQKLTRSDCGCGGLGDAPLYISSFPSCQDCDNGKKKDSSP